MEGHTIITSIQTQTLDHIENTNAELSLNNFTFDNFQENETFSTIETSSEIPHHGDTRLLGDKNIFKGNFWQMFLQLPLADFSLVFEDGTLMVNKAVLAVLSRNLSDILGPHHDCLQLADFSKKSFLGFLEILSQSSDANIEWILPEDVLELVKSLDMRTILSSNNNLEHRDGVQVNTDNQPKGDIQVQMPPNSFIPDSNAGDDEDEEVERGESSVERSHTANLQPRVSRPAGRPTGSKNGSGQGKTCEDCGGKVLDAWKHRRQCIAINNDIKYVCHGCKKGFRRFGAIKKHFQSLKKCKNNKMNQNEYSAVMKYMEKEVKGRTICYDCGCEYLTKKGVHEHRKNCSAFTQFKCFKCSRGINSMDGFHIHFSKFPECREAPENTEILSEILAKSQKPEFHVCYLCGAKYKTKESIEKHMMTHSDNLDYFHCPQPDCDKKLMTRKALNLHLKNHAMPKTVCTICGKQIKAGSMALHMVLHTGKKIECELCGKLFQHKGVLNKHMKNAHDPKKMPRVPKEKKKKVKKEVAEQKKVGTQLPPMQSIQVHLADEGDNVRVSLPSVVGPGLTLSVPEINSVNMPTNNYQNILLPALNTSSIQTYLSSSPWSK